MKFPFKMVPFYRTCSFSGVEVLQYLLTHSQVWSIPKHRQALTDLDQVWRSKFTWRRSRWKKNLAKWPTYLSDLNACLYQHADLQEMPNSGPRSSLVPTLCHPWRPCFLLHPQIRIKGRSSQSGDIRQGPEILGKKSAVGSLGIPAATDTLETPASEMLVMVMLITEVQLTFSGPQDIPTGKSAALLWKNIWEYWHWGTPAAATGSHLISSCPIQPDCVLITRLWCSYFISLTTCQIIRKPLFFANIFESWFKNTSTDMVSQPQKSSPRCFSLWSSRNHCLERLTPTFKLGRWMDRWSKSKRYNI